MSKNTTVPQAPTADRQRQVEAMKSNGGWVESYHEADSTVRLTKCCKAYTSIDEFGVEYCKGCYQAVTR
jgi:hypothetical protein